MDIEVIYRFGSTGTPFLGHGGHRDPRQSRRGHLEKQRLEPGAEQTPASMSGDTGITGRLDLRWNLAGQKQLTFTLVIRVRAWSFLRRL
jgi:hypothetical protein